MLSNMLFGIPPTVHAASAETEQKKCENCPGVCKPSQLPVYPNDSCKCRNPSMGEPGKLHNSIEGPIKCVRVHVQKNFGKLLEVNDGLKVGYDNTVNNTKWIVEYLREEDNSIQRAGAVAMGSLTGFILGLRGGIIKRLWYASIGTGIMGAICYPDLSEAIAKDAFANGKQMSRVAYNFFYGVKPGDPQPEFNFPELKLPHNFSEFADLSSNLGKSIKNLVTPPPSVDDKKPPEEKKQ